MTRVVAMFSARRVIVEISRIVGKDEKSSGRWIHSATIRISTEKAMEKASPKSMRNGGMGRNRIDRIITIPSAKPMSRLFGASFGIVSVACCAMSLPSLHERRAARHARLPQTMRADLEPQACARVVSG
ncbi:hypothetical protein ABIA25_002975 [Sinorhizobium fredii]